MRASLRCNSFMVFRNYLAEKKDMTEQPCHVRSTSMPSRSHPIALRVDAELQELKARIVSSFSCDKICDAFTRLVDLYDDMDELLFLPCSQQALSQPQEKKLVAQELDGSIRLLDLCGAMRDILAATREQVQELEFSLRRKDETSIENRVQSHMKTAKKTLKVIKKGIHAILKQKDDNCGSCHAIQVMREAREITVSLLSTLVSLLAPKLQQETNNWFFVSKDLRKRRVMACEGDNKDIFFSLFSVYESVYCKEFSREKLAALVNQIEDIEKGAECVYRRLIRSRVSLLNLFSM